MTNLVSARAKSSKCWIVQMYRGGKGGWGAKVGCSLPIIRHKCEKLLQAMHLQYLHIWRLAPQVHGLYVLSETNTKTAQLMTHLIFDVARHQLHQDTSARRTVRQVLLKCSHLNWDSAWCLFTTYWTISTFCLEVMKELRHTHRNLLSPDTDFVHSKSIQQQQMVLLNELYFILWSVSRYLFANCSFAILLH